MEQRWQRKSGSGDLLFKRRFELLCSLHLFCVTSEIAWKWTHVLVVHRLTLKTVILWEYPSSMLAMVVVDGSIRERVQACSNCNEGLSSLWPAEAKPNSQVREQENRIWWWWWWGGLYKSSKKKRKLSRSKVKEERVQTMTATKKFAILPTLFLCILVRWSLCATEQSSWESCPKANRMGYCTVPLGLYWEPHFTHNLLTSAD